MGVRPTVPRCRPTPRVPSPWWWRRPLWYWYEVTKVSLGQAHSVSELEIARNLAIKLLLNDATPNKLIMSRSSIKGPYVDAKLDRKSRAILKAAGKRNPSKPGLEPARFLRSSLVTPFGSQWQIHKEVFITEDMVGHRLGEFSLHSATFVVMVALLRRHSPKLNFLWQQKNSQPSYLILPRPVTFLARLETNLVLKAIVGRRFSLTLKQLAVLPKRAAEPPPS